MAAVGATWIAIQPPRRRGFAGPPTIEDPRRADPGGPPPSGPVPTPSLPSWRSAGSSPAGIEPRASIARARPWLSPTSHKLLVLLLARRTTMLSPSTMPPLSLRSRAAPRVTSMILARDPAALRRTLIEWPMIRVASAEAGRQPFPPPRAHDDAVRSTRRTLREEAAAIARRRVRTPKASPELQRDRLEMSGPFWLGPRSNAPTSPRRDGCSR